ncbi:helix-turn-helix domain-containing protein [Kistimonas asteriae]|uniref:helix-turn-helix domain-containing protein n=1 Tax=Kistimonas asteriae TaxID=517724 RepID=UPI001BA7164B
MNNSEIQLSSPKRVGDICRIIRVRSNRSQESLALDVGVAVSTIERIENGKVIPKFSSLLNIFNSLDYDLILRIKNE